MPESTRCAGSGTGAGGLVTLATSKAGREASGALLARKVKATGKPATVGEDKAYDCAPHGEALRNPGVTPHVARNNGPAKMGKAPHDHH